MSVEKNQLLKVGDKVKILSAILSVYPKFPYVGVIGRVCTVIGSTGDIGVEFSTPCNYLHDLAEQLSPILAGGVLGGVWNLYMVIIRQIFGNILNKSEVLLEFN